MLLTYVLPLNGVLKPRFGWVVRVSEIYLANVTLRTVINSMKDKNLISPQALNFQQVNQQAVKFP